MIRLKLNVIIRFTLKYYKYVHFNGCFFKSHSHDLGADYEVREEIMLDMGNISV